jgi:hypothetical protein
LKEENKMKIEICTINMNEVEGRQTIYWDTEDKLLHSTADDPDNECPEYSCESIEDAEDTAYQLWGKVPGWDLEWIEREE